MAVLAAERRRLMLNAVRSGEAARVSELAQRFEVSPMTIRRDLAQLADEGKITRVHGGAVRDEDEPPFAAMLGERGAAKARVGRAAASLIQDGQVVLIDIGTTTLALARQLAGRRLTVITSNLAVIEELLPAPDIELIVLGGTVRRNYRSIVGVFAEDLLRQVSADLAFIGASAIRHDDLSVMDTTMVEVPIKRGMMAAARQRVLLVDARKFGMSATIRVCGAADFDQIVTDANDREPCLGRLARAGVEVIQA